MLRRFAIAAALGLAGLLVGACTPAPVGRWSFAQSPPEHVTSGQSATLLNNGLVLTDGGLVNGAATATVKRYDPASNQWLATSAMQTARREHTATLLSDGRLLVAGGFGGGPSLSSAEVYSAATGQWTSVSSMSRPRSAHQAARLTNGGVLVADSSGAEYYSPSTGQWTSTGNIPLPNFDPDGDEEYYQVVGGPVLDSLVAVSESRAVAIFRGEVAELPECPGSCSSSYIDTAVMLYTSSTNSWTQAADMPVQRAEATATLLSNGRVLVTGGYQTGHIGIHYESSAAEVYDPGLNTWYSRAPMETGRVGHTATLLTDGQVLVAGGRNDCDCEPVTYRSAELYNPNAGGPPQWDEAASMTDVRTGHLAVRLNDGRVLVTGGSAPTAELFSLQ